MTALIKVVCLLLWFQLIFSFKKCKCFFIRNCRVIIREQGFIDDPLCLNVVFECLLFNSLTQLPSKHDSSYRCNKFLVCEKISSNCSPSFLSKINNTEIDLLQNSWNGFAVLGHFGSKGIFQKKTQSYPTFEGSFFKFLSNK